MPSQHYDPLRSKFTATCLADLCATYYAVITSFGNHWDDIRADQYPKLKDLPPARYGKPSAFRLFYLRRYIEKAIELIGWNDLLKLDMFRQPLDKLKAYTCEELRGIVIDSWLRPPDHLDVVVYVPSSPPICYLSVKQEQTSRDGSDEQDTSVERCKLQLEARERVKIKYVSRSFVYAENVTLTKIPRVPPHQMDALALLTSDAEALSKSLICLPTGELTFEFFGFFESTDANRLSELTFYAVEPFIYMGFSASREHYRQAMATVASPSGKEYIFRADLRAVRPLSRGQECIGLTKRIWNTDYRFILDVETVDEPTFQKIFEKSQQNFSSLMGRFTFLNASDLLESLPRQGEERQLGELEPGHYVVHPEYGPGVVVGKVEVNGEMCIECQFQKKHYKAGRILIPVSRKLPAYWSDLALLGA